MRNKVKSSILVIIFVVAMVFPTTLYYAGGFDKTEDNKENRELAEFPAIEEVGWDNYFPAIEEYVNDHAAFKNEIVRLNNLIDLSVFNSIQKTDVLLGEDRWLFSSDEKSYSDPYMDYKRVTSIDENGLALIGENINAFQSLCDELGIEPYLFVAPNKEQIYPEQMPQHVKVLEGESRFEATKNYIDGNCDIPLIYPIDELKEAKTVCQDYYQYDTHWNRLGGFVGSQSLLAAITGEYAELSDYEILVGDNISGDLARMLSLDDVLDDDTEYGIDYKPEITVETVENEMSGYYIHTRSNAENGKVLMMICDSYSINMRQYLSKDFTECYFVRREAYEEGMITEISPDYLVYEVVERLSDTVLREDIVKIINGR